MSRVLGRLDRARALAIIGWAGAASFWWDKHPEAGNDPEFVWIAFMEWMQAESPDDAEVAEALRDGIPAWLRDGVVEFLKDEQPDG